MSKVVLGQLIKVENTEKKNLENDNYVALQVEDQDGGNERCILFTEVEVSDLDVVDNNVWFNKFLVNGRIYPLKFGEREFFVIKIKNTSEEEKIVRLTKSQLERAEQRPLKNPEDLTKKSWLTDLLD